MTSASVGLPDRLVFRGHPSFTSVLALERIAPGNGGGKRYQDVARLTDFSLRRSAQLLALRNQGGDVACGMCAP